MRPLLACFAVLLLSACSSAPEAPRTAHIVVIDAKGAPVAGALVLPEIEDDRGPDPIKPTKEEWADRTSDAQGLVFADMKTYYWPSDDCFHFMITKPGYQDATFSVSRELFPSQIKIRLDVVDIKADANPAPLKKSAPKPAT